MRAMELNDSDGAGSSVSWRLVFGVLLASTLVTTAVLYQKMVASEWDRIPAAVNGDLDTMQARLDAVDALMERRPLWLGSPNALRERTQLSTELQVLRTKRVLSDSREAEDRQLELANAVASRQRGLELAGTGDYAAALAHFEHALQVAPADWADAEQVGRDVQSIHAWLEEKNK